MTRDEILNIILNNGFKLFRDRYEEYDSYDKAKYNGEQWYEKCRHELGYTDEQMNEEYWSFEIERV